MADQIHAVVKTIDQTEVGRAVQLEDPRRLLVLIDEDDGPPIPFAEFRIDALDFAIGLLLQGLISRQGTARWCRDLQETNASAMPRILVEQRLQRMEPLDDALGEIPALDTEPDDHIRADLVSARAPPRGTS